MREWKEYKEEILRRSEERIARRRRRIRYGIGLGSALCLCLIIGGLFALPHFMLKIDGDGMVYNGGSGEPEASGDIKYYADSLAGAADEDKASGGNSSAPREWIKKSKGYGSIGISLPKSWKYEWKEAEGFFDLRIAPKSAKEGWLRIEYSSAFGVCGTGLSVEKIRLGAYEAEQGTYDNAAIWNYIHLEGTPGAYTIYTESVGSWWADYEQEAMATLATLQVGEGIINEQEAIALAKKEILRSYEQVWADFKSDSGRWEICFYNGRLPANSGCVVAIDPKGQVLSVKEEK